MLRLALFDCDGTLVDSQAAIIAAMEAGFTAVGRTSPPGAVVRRVVGLSLVDAIARLAPDAESVLHHRIADAYKQAFQDNRLAERHLEPLYPGIADALDRLEADGFLLGVATGKSQRGLRAVLERHGLTGRFVTLQTADIAAGKPDPDMVHRALAETGAAPSGTVVIGDTSFDMMMAKNAGVAALGVAWGYHDPHELTATGAARVVESADEVPGAVASLARV